MIFYNFLTSWHTYWQFIWMQNKEKDKCAHLQVMTDDRWRITVCSSVFQGTQSASLDIWTPLDNFFSVKMTCSLSLSLSVSVCLSLSLTHSNSVTSLSLSLSLSPSLAPGSLFKNWHLSACSQKHLSELLFHNSKAAPSSSRSRVEVIVVVGLPYVMSFMSTRRSANNVKKRLGSIQEELQKSFPTADTLPEKTPDHLEPENAAQNRHSEENVHDELQRSVKTPSNLQRKVAFCPPGRRRAPLLRCNMSDLKSVYKIYCKGRDFRRRKLSYLSVQNLSYGFNFLLSEWPDRLVPERLRVSLTLRTEENLVWNLISYFFQPYGSYKIKFLTKISSCTVH